MNRLLSIISILLFWGSTVWAIPAKVTVTGASPCEISNKLMGKDRTRLTPKEGSTDIIVPDSLCGKWLILRAGEEMSRIYLLPGENLSISVDNGKWNFSGRGADINRYLYDWYRAFYHDKPNVMLRYTERTLFWGKSAPQPTVEEMSQPDYLAWLSGLNDKAQKELENAGHSDKEFVRKQSEWAYCAWVELSVYTYLELLKENIVPQSCLDFLKNVFFDSSLMMEYDGFNKVMHAFFRLDESVNGISCPAADYLKGRTQRIRHQKLKEQYVLSELYTLVFKNLTYQSEQIWASVEGDIVSPEGKRRYADLKEKMAELRARDKTGTVIKPFAWESLDGSIIRSSKYAGKYLLIDAWGTHCGPCKEEMPYLRKLETYFKDTPISFLTLCLDPAKNKEIWRKMSKELGIVSDCVIIAPDGTDNGRGWKNYYEIHFVPRYMLFDPNGKLVILHGRRPSDPVLKRQLQDILNDRK